MINNINNFNHWCVSRVLSLNRKYAKELLNSAGAAQAVTDKDRADIALSYHCVSLTDVYWVKKEDENITFAKLNLYDHPLNDAIVELSLKGRPMTVTRFVHERLFSKSMDQEKTWVQVIERWRRRCSKKRTAGK